MERMVSFHNFLLWIIFAVAIFVLALMAYACIRFSKKCNPTPSKRSHHTALEVIWTLVPVLILVVIGYFSIPLLYYAEEHEETEMTLKVIGYQWYWGYQYPEHNIEFESNIISDDELKDGDVRLLSVDNPVVLPINTKIRLQTTAADVIHAWAVPSFAIKIDAVPGRLNETWMEITKEGTYYGQCSELCGVNHGFMPVEITAVSKEAFAAWVTEKQTELGVTPPAANITTQ